MPKQHKYDTPPQGGSVVMPIIEQKPATTQIKSFRSSVSTDDLDNQVNRWLATNTSEIISVIPCSVYADSRFVYMVTVVYRES